MSSDTASSAEKTITVDGPWHTPGPAWSPGWDGVGSINDGWGDPLHPERFDDTWVTVQYFHAPGFEGDFSFDLPGELEVMEQRILFGWNFYRFGWMIFDVHRHVENYLLPVFEQGSDFYFNNGYTLDWDSGYENLPVYDIEVSAPGGTPLGPIEIYFRGTVTWSVDPNSGPGDPTVTVPARVAASTDGVYNVHTVPATAYDYSNYAVWDVTTRDYFDWLAELGLAPGGSTVVTALPSRTDMAGYPLDGTIPVVLSPPTSGDLAGSHDFTYAVTRTVGDEDANGCITLMVAPSNYESNTDIPDIGDFYGFFPDEPVYGNDMLIDTYSMRMWYQPPDYRLRYYDTLSIWVDYVNTPASNGRIAAPLTFAVGEHARLYVEPRSFGDAMVVVDWADGSTDRFAVGQYNEPPIVGHTYKRAGTFVATFTVETRWGSVSTTFDIRVRPSPSGAAPRHSAKALFTPRTGMGPSTLSNPDDTPPADNGGRDGQLFASGSSFE